MLKKKAMKDKKDRIGIHMIFNVWIIGVPTGV